MEHRLRIQKYSKHGHGLAPLENSNYSAEVVGSVVGDLVDVSIGKYKKKRNRLATLLQVVEPSDNRTQPRCSHAGSCGGCSWQQLSYDVQVYHKQGLLARLFSGYSLLPCIPCNDPWRYRNKMEFSFSQNRDLERFLGLIIARSRGHVINLNECHLTPKWFIDVLKAVYTWWENSGLQAYHIHSDHGVLRSLTIREAQGSEKMVILTVAGNPEKGLRAEQLLAFKKAVRGVVDNPSLFLQIQTAIKASPTQYYEMHLGGPDTIEEHLHVHGRTLRCKISPSSFFQPNPRQSEILYSRALEVAKPTANDIVFDLYCGTGTLGMLFAPYVKHVIGIELNPYAVFDGKENIEINSIDNMTIYQGDVGETLSNLEIIPDLVIVEPPRSGLMPKAIQHLLALAPKKILYIGCNPYIQSENVLELVSKGKYQLSVVQGVDQFPHTPHLETITLLEKASIGYT